MAYIPGFVIATLILGVLFELKPVNMAIAVLMAGVLVALMHGV